MNRSWIMRLVLLFVAAILCMGWADSWEALRSSAGTITSVRAEFEQEKHLAILSKPLISNGRFFYRSPGSLRWEYLQPVQSVLLMHDGKINRFVKGGGGFEKAYSGGLEAMKVVMDQIALWMTGRFDESPLFNPRLDPMGVITLIPKNAELRSVINKIEIRMTEQPGIIEDVVIYENEDAYTRMRFSKTVLNGKIEEIVFRGPR